MRSRRVVSIQHSSSFSTLTAISSYLSCIRYFKRNSLLSLISLCLSSSLSLIFLRLALISLHTCSLYVYILLRVSIKQFWHPPKLGPGEEAYLMHSTRSLCALLSFESLHLIVFTPFAIYGGEPSMFTRRRISSRVTGSFTNFFMPNQPFTGCYFGRHYLKLPDLGPLLGLPSLKRREGVFKRTGSGLQACARGGVQVFVEGKRELEGK
jgi:hypothetical protein